MNPKTSNPKPGTKNTSLAKEPQSLKEVQKALAKVESQRADSGLTNEDIHALEEVSVALRHLERLLISKESDLKGKEIRNSAELLLELARKIRKKSKKLSATAKMLEKINYSLRQTLTVLEKVLL